jgi:hypothetical protein
MKPVHDSHISKPVLGRPIEMIKEKNNLTMQDNPSRVTVVRFS